MREPAHPYTQGLLNSFPSLRGPRRELAGIPGSPPDLRDPLPGCPFLPRCKHAIAACARGRHVARPGVRPGDPAGALVSHLTACPFVTPR